MLLKIYKDKTSRKKNVHSTAIEPMFLWFGTFSLADWASDVIYEIAALLPMDNSYMENFS
jgi:hypothetical protein